LSDLRGRFVLLDFWTLCCVNCHHVLAELRELEAEFADILTVIGVHSPKFEHERDLDAVSAAVARHGIHHPVLNDPDLHTWQAYAVRAWPTLVLIDPVGRIIATYSGEGHGHAIAATLREAAQAAQAEGILTPGPDIYVAEDRPTGVYNQPGAALMLDNQQLVVSDTGNHRLVITTVDDPHTPLAVIGDGQRGHRDGADAHARFNEPLGLALLPRTVADVVGYDVVVADSANHLLRGVRLADRSVRTIAGTGAQWMQGQPTLGAATDVALSTPWDVAWFDDSLLVAMAGDHRLWRFDPIHGDISTMAGTTNEGLVDGPPAQSWFAQPSALAPAGDVVWLADAETSALRQVSQDMVTTVVGKGLFDFGHVDGPAHQARLQHPLGLAVTSDGDVLIADTYNGAIRRYHPGSGTVTTVAQGLREPVGVVLTPDDSTMLVVEGAAGRITTIAVESGKEISGPTLTTSRPVTELAAGAVELVVDFVPPPGQIRDERYGPATSLVVTATPPQLLRAGEGRGTGLTRTLELDPAVGDGVLHVAARGASCDSSTATDHAACYIHQQDWGIPVRLVADGSRHLTLALAAAQEH
jgi:thiol-disulfide isomerase/thioredoxin